MRKLFYLFFSIPLLLSANDPATPPPPSSDYTNCQAPENRPDNNWSNWARRTDVFWRTEQRTTPAWSLQTIQPFYQTAQTYRNTWFGQAQFTRAQHSQTYNLGMGYRYLSRSENWLVGTNIFYDVVQRHTDQRLGAGFEAYYRNITLRLNYYQPITGSTKIKTTCPTKQSETALTGFAGEFDFPMPYFPWIRFNFDGFYSKRDTFRSIHGGGGALQLNLTSFLTLQMGRRVSNQNNSNFLQINLSFGKPPEIEYTMVKNFVTRAAFPNRCLPRHTLEKVMRNNTISTQQKTVHRICVQQAQGAGSAGGIGDPCTTVSNCQTGYLCENNLCAGCLSDANCSIIQGLPYCNISNQKCVQCVANSNCPPNAPVCNLSTNTCGPCTQDTQCPPGQACVNGICQ